MPSSSASRADHAVYSSWISSASTGSWRTSARASSSRPAAAAAATRAGVGSACSAHVPVRTGAPERRPVGELALVARRAINSAPARGSCPPSTATQTPVT